MNPVTRSAGAGMAPGAARSAPVPGCDSCPVVPAEPAFTGSVPHGGPGSVTGPMNRMMR